MSEDKVYTLRRLGIHGEVRVPYVQINTFVDGRLIFGDTVLCTKILDLYQNVDGNRLTEEQIKNMKILSEIEVLKSQS